MVSEKVDLLGQAYEELGQLAQRRRERLEDSRRLWQFLWDIGEEAAWIREQEQILASGDCGRDLTSALHLLSKHEAFRDEMAARYGPLSNSIAVGEALIKEGHFGAPQVRERVQDIRGQWTHLEEVGYNRYSSYSIKLFYLLTYLSLSLFPLLPRPLSSESRVLRKEWPCTNFKQMPMTWRHGSWKHFDRFPVRR